MNLITIPHALVTPEGDKPLTPAMVRALWIIGDEVDRRRVPANIDKDSITLKIKTAKLRGENARNDNVWLRKCLDRLTGIKFSGEYRGDPWGAVMVAQWKIIEGGTVAEITLPSMAIRALRAPEIFAKIEDMAAYKLQGAARRLYAALADKKRMKRDHYTFSLDELRFILDAQGKKAYQRWNNLRFRVLDPALEAVNDFGTVKVTMTPIKIGRAINAVRFDWAWKSLDEATETDEENQKPDIQRRKKQETKDMPPLSDGTEAEFRQADFDLWLNKNPGGKKTDYFKDVAAGDFYWRPTPEEKAKISADILKEYGFDK